MNEDSELVWEDMEHRIESSGDIVTSRVLVENVLHDERLGGITDVFTEIASQQHCPTHLPHDVIVTNYDVQMDRITSKTELNKRWPFHRFNINNMFSINNNSDAVTLIVWCVLVLAIFLVSYWFYSSNRNDELRPKNKKKRDVGVADSGTGGDHFTYVVTVVESLQERTLAIMRDHNMERTNILELNFDTDFVTNADTDCSSVIKQRLECTDFAGLIGSVYSLLEEYAGLLKYIDSELTAVIDTKISRLREFKRQVLRKIQWNIDLLNNVLSACMRCRYSRKRVLLTKIAESQKKLALAKVRGEKLLQTLMVPTETPRRSPTPLSTNDINMNNNMCAEDVNINVGSSGSIGIPAVEMNARMSALSLSTASPTSSGLSDLRDAVILFNAVSALIEPVAGDMHVPLNFSTFAPQIDYKVELVAGSMEEQRVQDVYAEAELLIRMAGIPEYPSVGVGPSLARLHQDGSRVLLAEVMDILHNCEAAADDAVIDGLRQRLEMLVMSAPAATNTGLMITDPVPTLELPAVAEKSAGEFFATSSPHTPMATPVSTPAAHSRRWSTNLDTPVPSPLFAGGRLADMASTIVEGQRYQHSEYISGLRFVQSKLNGELEMSENQYRAHKQEFDGNKAHFEKCYQSIEQKLDRLRASIVEAKRTQQGVDVMFAYSTIIFCFFLVTAIQLFNNVVSNGQFAYLTQMWILMDQICCAPNSSIRGGADAGATMTGADSGTGTGAGTEVGIAGIVGVLHNASDWLASLTADVSDRRGDVTDNADVAFTWKGLSSIGWGVWDGIASKNVADTLFWAFRSLNSLSGYGGYAGPSGVEVKRVLDIVCCLGSLVIIPAVIILLLRYFRCYLFSGPACLCFAYYLSVNHPAILTLLNTHYVSLRLIIALQVVLQGIVYWLDDRLAWNVTVPIPHISLFQSSRSRNKAVLVVNAPRNAHPYRWESGFIHRALTNNSFSEKNRSRGKGGCEDKGTNGDKDRLLLTSSGARIRTRNTAVLRSSSNTPCWWGCAGTGTCISVKSFNIRPLVMYLLVPLFLCYMASLLACVPTVHSRGIALGAAPDDWAHRHTCALHILTRMMNEFCSLILTPLYNIAVTRIKRLL